MPCSRPSTVVDCADLVNSHVYYKQTKKKTSVVRKKVTERGGHLRRLRLDVHAGG